MPHPIHHHDATSAFSEKANPIFGHQLLALQREDDPAGRLHVHFPRMGFVLKAVRA